MSTSSTSRAGSTGVAPDLLASTFTGLMPQSGIEIREGYANFGDQRLH